MLLCTSNAQGTIEYLVIIAIVVVLGLVVVGLISGFGDVVGIQEGTNSAANKANSSGISVTEAVMDLDNGVLVLNNIGGEPITITNVNAGGENNPYNRTVFFGEEKSFVLDSVGLDCLCQSGDKAKTCSYVVTYRTQDGLQKTLSFNVINECVETAATISGTTINTDRVAPSIELTSPADDSNTASRTVSFAFSLSEAGSCTLNAGSESEVYLGLTRGDNIVNHTFSSDTLADWNISCTDTSNNTGLSETRTIDVDFSAYQITTCAEMQEINLDLSGSYELMNDINCTGVTFTPIGTNSTPFTGTLDGQSHAINDLHIARNDLTYVGLFGYISAAGSVSDLDLSDLNIYSINSSDAFVGGLAGYSGGTITGVSAFGNVFGATSSSANYARVGGIVGRSLGTITNCNSAVNFSILSGSVGRIHLGGIAGEVGDGASVYGTATNCSSTGDINASSSGNRVISGGIVGYLTGNIYDSHATGQVYSNVTSVGPYPPYAGGLVGWVFDGNVWRSYATGNITIEGGGQAAGNAGPRAGGLAGGVSSSGKNGGVYYSFATGNVHVSTGVDNANSGGLVGVLSQRGIISDSFATGNAYAYGASTSPGYQTTAGGLVAFAQTGGWKIMQSYAVSDITSSAPTSVQIGLLVGGSSSTSANTIINSFAIGSTSGSGAAQLFQGGLQGWIGCMPSTVLNNYWYLTGTYPTACTEYINIGSLTDANCSQVLTGTNYFYTQVNPPLNSWSDSIWYFNGSGLPVLKWANDLGIMDWENGIPFVK